MKNLSSVMLFLLLCTPLFAEAVNPALAKEGGNVKSLIVYYSYSGNTELVAKTFASEINADLCRIEDTERPSKFKAYVSGARAARKGHSWPVKPVTADLAAYDRIYVGAPIWWGYCAPEINAFLDQANFAGKPVVVFVTMGGSNPDSALKALAARVQTKGGVVSSSFSVKTGGKSTDAISAQAREIAGRYK